MMRKATGRVTGKYGYNFTCPRCGFVIKFADAKLDWRGVWLCKADWEPRHPMDFFRQKSDAHVLQITRPDNDVLSWTPVFGNLTVVLGSGAESVVANYSLDAFNTITKFKVTILVTPPATTQSGAGNTITLPTTATAAGTFVVTKKGQILGTGTIAALATTITLPTWAANYESIDIAGQYGT